MYPSMHWAGGCVYPSMHWAGGVCLGGVCPGGVSAQGVSAQGGVCRGGLPKCMLGYPPLVNRITDACENITLRR